MVEILSANLAGAVFLAAGAGLGKVLSHTFTHIFLNFTHILGDIVGQSICFLAQATRLIFNISNSFYGFFLDAFGPALDITNGFFSRGRGEKQANSRAYHAAYSHASNNLTNSNLFGSLTGLCLSCVICSFLFHDCAPLYIVFTAEVRKSFDYYKSKT